MSGFRNWRAGSGCPSGTLEKFEALLTALRNCLVGKSAGFGIWPNFPQRVRRLCGLLHTDDDGGTCLRQSICPAHFGTCTIARRRGRGVLEIQLLNGRWIEIPPPEGCAVLTFADMLQWWTQHIIRSTPHRVIAGRGSQSLVTFCYADFWARTQRRGNHRRLPVRQDKRVISTLRPAVAENRRN